jgi:hypothetical protein
VAVHRGDIPEIRASERSQKGVRFWEPRVCEIERVLWSGILKGGGVWAACSTCCLSEVFAFVITGSAGQGSFGRVHQQAPAARVEGGSPFYGGSGVNM